MSSKRKSVNGPDSHDSFAEEMRAKQQNVVWPGPVVNGSLVDEFLFKGRADASLMQRIGAWLAGLTMIGSGLVILSFMHAEGSLLGVLLSVGTIALGGWICFNGCRVGR